VLEADSRLDLIDVLSAGAAGAESLKLALAQQLVVCFRQRYHSSLAYINYS
jgi:hypothetical protein